MAQAIVARSLARGGWQLARRTYARNPRFFNAAASRAAGVIARAWRRRRATMRRVRRRVNQHPRLRIGHPVGAQTVRRRVCLSDSGWDGGGPVLKNTKSLYDYVVTEIPQGYGPDERLRDLVNFRGIQIRMVVKNELDDDNLLFNYALISPKNEYVVTSTDFFRSLSNQRGTDFDNQNLYAMDYFMRPINADKFNILMHKRMKVGHKGTKITSTALSSTSNRMHYIRIKRQLRYGKIFEDEQGNVTEACLTPIYFVYWATMEATGTTAQGDPIRNCFFVQLNLNCYFKNPRE